MNKESKKSQTKNNNLQIKKTYKIKNSNIEKMMEYLKLKKK
jgi:hypothetical protein